MAETNNKEKSLFLVLCLHRYPDELGWQLNSSRQEVRKDARFEKLKTFLLQETESVRDFHVVAKT